MEPEGHNRHTVYHRFEKTKQILSIVNHILSYSVDINILRKCSSTRRTCIILKIDKQLRIIFYVLQRNVEFSKKMEYILIFVYLDVFHSTIEDISYEKDSFPAPEIQNISQTEFDSVDISAHITAPVSNVIETLRTSVRGVAALNTNKRKKDLDDNI